MTTPPMPVTNPADLKDAYPFTCAACGHAAYAAPSIAMRSFGANIGYAHCPRCRERLNLHLNPDNTTMTSRLPPRKDALMPTPPEDPTALLEEARRADPSADMAERIRTALYQAQEAKEAGAAPMTTEIKTALHEQWLRHRF